MIAFPFHVLRQAFSESVFRLMSFNTAAEVEEAFSESELLFFLQLRKAFLLSLSLQFLMSCRKTF